MSAGRGECIYELGMLDDDASVPLNLTSADFDAALATLASIVANPPLCAAVTFLGEKSPTHSTAQTVEALLTTPSTATSTSTALAATLLAPPPAPAMDPNNRCGYLLIRRIPSNVQDVMEVRVAVCGNVDAGKSSCLGVLTKNALDNGRGKARAALFRHKHELETGRTSSLGMECVGFDARGAQVGVGYNPATDAARGGAVAAPGGAHEHAEGDEDEADATPTAPTPIRKAGWDEIAHAASKVLTFIDLAGHEKYLKTTVYGLCGTAPDFAMLMVGANMGIIGMTKEHLGLNLALNVPVMIVVTKIDMCPGNVLEATLKQLLKVLKSPGCRKIPMFVRSHEDVVRVSNTFVSDRICPIFLVSNVTGQGLPYLRQFLNLLPMMTKYAPDAPVEYQITESFSVPGVGTVVSGTILSGVVCVGDQLMLGPDTLGNFTLTQVKGIHIKRVPVPVASAGHTASFALKKIKRAQLRKGMVLVSPNPAPFASREFEAECLILFHSTTINTKYQAMLHCGNVRQTASLVDMDRGVLRSGDRARVRFRFLQYPEYIKPGARVLFREGRTKGIGKVTRVYAPGEVIEPFNSDEVDVRAAHPTDEPQDIEPPSTPARSTAPPPGAAERSPRFKAKSAATAKVAPATAAAAGAGSSTGV
ncbi:P-loop containing nucleoside triphosphate hydrolase protein, partial [Catenaria anguillulae PL171]